LCFDDVEITLRSIKLPRIMDINAVEAVEVTFQIVLILVIENGVTVVLSIICIRFLIVVGRYIFHVEKRIARWHLFR
jgi:hypothetical protein